MIGRDFSKVGVERNIFQKIKNGTRETLIGPIKIYWLDSTNFAIVDSLKSVHFQSVYGHITTTIVANTKSALRVGNTLLEDAEEIGGKGHDPSHGSGHRSDRQVLIDLDMVANDISLVPGTKPLTHSINISVTLLTYHSYALSINHCLTQSSSTTIYFELPLSHTLFIYHYLPRTTPPSHTLDLPLTYTLDLPQITPLCLLKGTTKFAIADARKFISFIDTAHWEMQDGFGKYQNPKKKQEDLSVQVIVVTHCWPELIYASLLYPLCNFSIHCQHIISIPLIPQNLSIH